MSFQKYFLCENNVSECLSLYYYAFVFLGITQWTHFRRFDVEIPRGKFFEISSISGQSNKETMTSIRRGNFDVVSTFKIDKISMSCPRGFSYVVSTANRRNCFTTCFALLHHFATFSALGIYSKLIWYSTESM